MEPPHVGEPGFEIIQVLAIHTHTQMMVLGVQTWHTQYLLYTHTIRAIYTHTHTDPAGPCYTYTHTHIRTYTQMMLLGVQTWHTLFSRSLLPL